MLLADRAVLRHVASSLAHEPDGSAVDALRFAGANEGGIGSGHELLNLASLAELCSDECQKAITTEDTEDTEQKHGL